MIRAEAFAGLVFVDGTAAMVGLRCSRGSGTALFRPATYALLPGLVARERLAAANGLFNAVRETGFLLGPVLAAALLAAASPEAVLGVNASPSGSPRCCWRGCADTSGPARPAGAMTAPRPACARCSPSAASRC